MCVFFESCICISISFWETHHTVSFWEYIGRYSIMPFIDLSKFTSRNMFSANTNPQLTLLDLPGCLIGILVFPYNGLWDISHITGWYFIPCTPKTNAVPPASFPSFSFSVPLSFKPLSNQNNFTIKITCQKKHFFSWISQNTCQHQISPTCLFWQCMMLFSVKYHSVKRSQVI